MITILTGNVLDTLPTLPSNSVQCCVTSPPYWGLRSYLPDGHADKGFELGSEPTPEAYVANMVAVFREVKRVLRDDGTLWLNLGDSYNGSGGAGGDYAAGGLKDGQPKFAGRNIVSLKPKDLCGIPWRVAFALQEDGWWLRSEITWCKKAPMPESVTDRPTSATEKIFLLTKSARYFYDAEAVKEQAEYGELRATFRGGGTYTNNHSFNNAEKVAGDGEIRERPETGTRNQRNFWLLGPEPTRFWKISRQVDVALDAVSGDTICKVSASCPVHAGLLDQVPTASDGVRVDTLLLHTAGTYGRHAQAQQADCVATATPLYEATVGESLDSDLPLYSLSATDRNTQTNRIDHALQTSQRDSVSAQTDNHIQSTSQSELLFDSAERMPESNNGQVDLVDHLSAQTLSHNVRIFSLPVPPQCTCSFYHEITDNATHFATFPTEIPRRAILAGTSAYGACPTCGAPWERVVEKSGGDTEACERPKQTKGMSGRTSTLSLSGNGSKEWADRGSKVHTLGFAPTCACGCTDTVPCVVLDPFTGSGTTGAVARTLGRSFVGCELNPEYVKLAEKRIGHAQPALFGI